MDIVFVGVAGFFGALCRYFLYLVEPSQTFPYATLLINLSGCLIAGVLLGFGARIAPESRYYISLFSIGFVGSFTTFSTFSSETLRLLEANLLGQVSLNILANVLGGLAMVWIGKSTVTFFS